jgi:hypothetical protein
LPESVLSRQRIMLVAVENVLQNLLLQKARLQR